MSDARLLPSRLTGGKIRGEVAGRHREIIWSHKRRHGLEYRGEEQICYQTADGFDRVSYQCVGYLKVTFVLLVLS